MNGDTGHALTRDVAVLQFEPAPRYVDAIPFAIPHLLEGQIDNSAHGGLEQDTMLAACSNDDLASLPVADDLDRLVDHEAFLVEQPGPHQRFNTDQHFIAGKRRQWLVRGIAVGGGPGGQKLPDMDTHAFQRIDEGQGGISSIANAIGTRK